MDEEYSEKRLVNYSVSSEEENDGDLSEENMDVEEEESYDEEMEVSDHYEEEEGDSDEKDDREEENAQKIFTNPLFSETDSEAETVPEIEANPFFESQESSHLLNMSSEVTLPHYFLVSFLLCTGIRREFGSHPDQA